MRGHGHRSSKRKHPGTRKGKKKEERNDSCVREKPTGDGTWRGCNTARMQKERQKKRRKNGEREAGRREGKKRPKTHDRQVDATSVSAQKSRPRVTVGKHNGWESSNNAQRLSHNAPRGQLANGEGGNMLGCIPSYPRSFLHLPPPPLLPFPPLSSVTFSPSKSTNSWNGTPESTLKLALGARFRRACSAGWIGGVKSRRETR